MKKIFTILLSITFITNVLAQEKGIERLKQQIEETPYVIEGKIINVEIYAGDKEGNKIPLKDAIWQGGETGEASFKLEDGSRAIGYSKTTIQVCKIFKGNITTQTIELVTSSSSLEITLRKYKGKDTLMYHYWNPSHVDEELILPRNSIGQKHIFFCKNSSINTKELTLSGIGSINLNSKYKKNSSDNYKKIYAFNGGDLYAIKSKLYSEEELNTFLGQFKSLNTNVTNDCTPAVLEKKNVGSSEFLEEGKNKIDYQQQLNNYNNWLN